MAANRQSLATNAAQHRSTERRKYARKGVGIRSTQQKCVIDLDGVGHIELAPGDLEPLLGNDAFDGSDAAAERNLGVGRHVDQHIVGRVGDSRLIRGDIEPIAGR